MRWSEVHQLEKTFSTLVSVKSLGLHFFPYNLVGLWTAPSLNEYDFFWPQEIARTMFWTRMCRKYKTRQNCYSSLIYPIFSWFSFLVISVLLEYGTVSNSHLSLGPGTRIYSANVHGKNEWIGEWMTPSMNCQFFHHSWGLWYVSPWLFKMFSTFYLK